MPLKTPSVQQSLGLRIKELRALQSLTQEELADRCGMFRTYMSRIESGLANPTLTMLHTMAAALEVPIADLFMPATTQPAKVHSRQPIYQGSGGPLSDRLQAPGQDSVTP